MGEESAPGGIQIFYSAAGQTADAIVERLAAKYAQEHDITVATSDMMEQQTVSSFGAYTTDAEGLRALLTGAQSEFARQVKQHRRKK
jgi:predicted RNA-binding protein with PIN domain